MTLQDSKSPKARRLSSYTGLVANPGQAWVHNPLGIFCFCAAVTHLGSALTHVYPDSHALVSPCFLLLPFFVIRVLAAKNVQHKLGLPGSALACMLC